METEESEFDRGYSLGQRDCKEYYEFKLQALKEKVEPLKILLDTIQTSRKGSMGSIDNVYLPQLSVKSVREARESLNLITNK